MNSTENSRPHYVLNAVSVAGTFLIMAGLIWIMYYYTRPPAVDQARINERIKNLADLRAATDEQLENYGWIDQNKNWLRVPIKRGMELVAQEWKDPAQARSNLIARMEKLVPPVVPAITNQGTNPPASPVAPKPINAKP